MIITHGNFFRKGDPAGPRPTPYTLTDDTIVTGGNFILCRVANVGQFTNRVVDEGDKGGAFELVITGGNVRGLYVNDVKQDSYVWQRHEALQLAVDILNDAVTKGVSDGVEAWLWTVQYLFDNPTTNQAGWAAAYDAWVSVNGNAIDSARLFVRLRDKYFPAQSFISVRDAILVYDFATWNGESAASAGALRGRWPTAQPRR